MPERPAIYLLTWNTFGTWLHGDERGSVDRKGNTFREKFLGHDPLLEAANRRRMNHPPLILDARQRGCVRRAIESDCGKRGRQILALNVRTNHVHLVVAAHDSVDRVLHNVKAWSTRALRDAGLVDRNTPVWTSSGNKRVLDTPESVSAAIDYVLLEQGEDLPEE
ncbi:MAG: hypothetical protein ICCCNLDF_01856 [Planctomycetes bacterium]|nr:hypothetical protein [Planctomycetota bacterium]